MQWFETMRVMQVSQADQYVSTVFAYNLCTVQIMHNIFLVLSLFVLRRLVNSCVISDIVHFNHQQNSHNAMQRSTVTLFAITEKMYMTVHVGARVGMHVRGT